MAGKKILSSCEIPAGKTKKKVNRNRRYRFLNDFSWQGVKIRKYKTRGDDWAGIARQVLIGEAGETLNFHLRYFEIEPGGYSSFETHSHEHVVIGIRGKGRARVDRRNMDIHYLDVLYLKPDTPHRFYNPYREPFGFFCVVNSKRDRPRPAGR